MLSKNRAIQIQKDVYLCFIIYAKALLRNLAMFENDIRIIGNLYWQVVILAEMYADDTVFISGIESKHQLQENTKHC